MTAGGGAAAPGSARPATVLRVRSDGRERRDDALAIEEPLGIRLVVETGGRSVRHDVAVTMRTPGRDTELAVGFLFSEGVIDGPERVARVRECEAPMAEPGSVLEVSLAPGTPYDAERFRRHVYTSSSCGICGRAAVEEVRRVGSPLSGSGPRVEPEILWGLPERLRAGQAGFAATGGLHAAGLFDESGELLLLREDVGRHNAVDKVVGRLLLDGRLPASDTLLMVSGRASFELVQKAVLAGIPVLAAVGAPSSLAVELGEEMGMTIVGFLRRAQCNVYCGAERLAGSVDGP